METRIDQLEKLRILPSDTIPQHQFLYEWQDKPCFARGELVALTGKAKSGKTYVCSMLMALAERTQLMGIQNHATEPYRVLWIDTEQSEDSTQEILCERVGKLIEHAPDIERYATYNLRQCNWQDRLALVNQAICKHTPDLVIFDGIRDVVGDINDYQQAQDVLTKLLSIASWSNACIVCVLHQNKAAEDKTLRGALGTELQNKSFETYECLKDIDSHVFTLRQTATRKYDILGKLQFSVDDNGLPVLENPVAEVTPVARKTKGYAPRFTCSNGRLDQQKLFDYLLAGGKRMTQPQLRQAAMRAGQIESFSFASRVINEACEQGIIHTETIDGNIYYQLQPTLF